MSKTRDKANTPQTNFSSTGIDDNATSTAVTIDSSGQVGIGTSSPSAELHISKSADAGNAEFLIENSFTTAGSTDETVRMQGRFGGYDASYIVTGKELDFTTSGNRSSFMSFWTRGAGTLAEAMRIDSNGNVGIGTTTPDLGFGGTYLEVANLSQTPSITIRSDRAGGGSLQFGDQDDSNVGYISYQHNNDRMVFRAGDNQQVYIDGAGCMMLGTTTTGSAGNGDLVVNGNIYLGGTGSANALDDYEEGTWTPVFTSSGGDYTITYAATGQQGRYTKIGQTVICHFLCAASATAPSGGSGTFRLGNLPFLPVTGAVIPAGHGSIGISNNLNVNIDATQLLWNLGIDATVADLMFLTDSSGITSTSNAPYTVVHNANARIDGTIIYRTNA